MSAEPTRITSNPAIFGGRPCIRGLRIRVVDVLDLLAAGLSHSEIVAELPDLEPADVKAAIEFAARRVDHHALRTVDPREPLIEIGLS